MVDDKGTVCVIQVVGAANGKKLPIDGQYLQSFDFEAFGGQGYGEFTDQPELAKQFPDVLAATDFWRTISKTKPLRSDGQPNRPLTATTVAFLKYADVVGG